MSDTKARVLENKPALRAVAAAILLIASAAGWVALRAITPTDGAPSLGDPGYARGLTIDPSTPNQSGLRPGDVVVAVNELPLDVWLGRPARRPPLVVGTGLRYAVERDGRVFEVPVRLRRGGFLVPRLRSDGLPILVGGTVLGLGLFTVVRRPDQPAARSLLLFGAGLTTSATFETLAFDVAHLVAAPAIALVGFIGSLTGLTVMLLGLAQLAINFPTPPTWLARRRGLGAAVYWGTLAGNVCVGAVYLGSGRATLAGLEALNGPKAVLYAALGLTTLGGALRTGLRARHDPLVRRQAALVACGLLTTIIVLMSANVIAGDQKFPGWVTSLIFLPLCASVAVAIAKGEFLDIRATVNRTLVYVTATAILLAVFSVVAVVVGAVLGSNGVATALPATAIVAVTFAPVRDRVQGTVDRILYGARSDPGRVLGALGERLAAAVSPDRLLPEIAESLASTLRLPYVGIMTGTGDEALIACERGERPEQTEAIPLIHQGQSVGTLIVGPRRGEHHLGAADQTLLQSVAGHVGTAVSAASLLTEVAASRQRLVLAREEERARLRHDLHDRLGSQLAGLSMQLDGAIQLVGDSAANDELARAQEATDRALEEIRRISRGLRPAELDELGLAAAVAAAARRLSLEGRSGGWAVSVDTAVHLPPVPASIEAAGYQIALEAITNAYRHSGGNRARVKVSVDAPGDWLLIEVVDNGHGIPGDACSGVGMESMRRRADAVGGRVDIRARPTGGTVVHAELPIHGTTSISEGPTVDRPTRRKGFA